MHRLCTFIFILLSVVHGNKYTPDWKSLDSRPLPEWYDQAKIGIFMHFGPYSVPGFGSEWFWYNLESGRAEEVSYMKQFYSPRFTYQDFGSKLRMEFFNASHFAKLVHDAGAKYFVFTSKHHDGFVNFNSSYTFGWRSLDIGPKRDVVGELSSAFSEYPTVKFGLYHSLFEWFNPLYLADKQANFSTRHFVENKMMPELKQLVEKYHPEVIWSDGDWEALPEYWGSKDFLAWLFNSSPTKSTVVVNDRWGIGTSKKHGSFYSGPDRYNPGTLQKHKFEDATTVDKQSWGYRKNLDLQDIISPQMLIQNMVSVVACGGNFLLNVGPTMEGTISPIFEERLRTMGSWLNVNGEAIYGSNPWEFQNESSVEENIPIWYTARDDLHSVYAILFDWPSREPGVITSKYQLDLQQGNVTMLCYGSKSRPLRMKPSAKGLQVYLPSYAEMRAKCLKQQGVDTGFVLKFQIHNSTITPQEMIPTIQIV
ncbi:alpha-L-fucosidase [Lepeophtheirus salmonis]|uniref:alpha-L-fucosidase n=1 Tax=Lepeophtheirus salmonis TaxID=72036 RepID=UPI001AE2464B|nr:alpha-L-fucosidase-like [Lepeophtheirus salmonis]